MNHRRARKIADHVFLIMSGVGAAAALLYLKYFGAEPGTLSNIPEYMISLMSQMEYDFGQMLFYVVIDRGREIILLCLMNLTNLFVLYQGWYGFQKGFLFTLFCGIYTMTFGLPGLLIAVCLFFPHGFFLLYLLYLSSHYFKIYRRCHAGWKEWGKLIAGMTCVFLAMCLAESSVSVWILKEVLKLVS